MPSNWSIKQRAKLSYYTTNKRSSNKASEEAVRSVGRWFSYRVMEKSNSTLGRSRALPFPPGLPRVVPLERSPGPLPSPHRTQWRPELPPLSPRAASAPPARTAFPGPRTKEARGLLCAPRSPIPARPPGADASDPAPARLRASRAAAQARRGARPPTAWGSHCQGLGAVGARTGGHSLSRWSRVAGAPTACRGPPHPSETPAGSPPGPRWFSWATPAPPR